MVTIKIIDELSRGQGKFGCGFGNTWSTVAQRVGCKVGP